MCVWSTVFQDELDFCTTCAVTLERSASHALLQPQQARTRLSNINIDGINLLNGSQRHPLACGDKRPYGNRRFADAPGNRGGHAGVSQVDSSGLNGRLAGCNLRLCLFEGRRRIVIFLAAHRLDLHQFLVALRPETDGGDVGLGAG